MLHRYRRTLDSRSCHLHRSTSDETELVLLPLQRRSEDVRSTLGVSSPAPLHQTRRRKGTSSIKVDDYDTENQHKEIDAGLE